jgi:hypothetical protein
MPRYNSEEAWPIFSRLGSLQPKGFSLKVAEAISQIYPSASGFNF